ncbi:hypothetical protein FVF58_02695 [Paraburkholderia panacisoli]|uniref:Uncharacterized protein n=1 Tax=Paraburkholderia panacisoli TaxID=2603818 RepID=A0A5B0HIA3_9BURK|nr:hypothetical protein [Paraburkholderia panacisoli]KAA1014857.1 hypothetical protein FVF58_02695 [Paraburkholderia panacisoli]
MKHITKTFFASALAMALSAITYAQAGGSAGGLPTPGVGAGLMKTPNETGYGAPDVTGSGVGAARSIPRTERGKTNGLNKGTNSGANSDVNSGLGGSRQKGQ